MFVFKKQLHKQNKYYMFLLFLETSENEFLLLLIIRVTSLAGNSYPYYLKVVQEYLNSSLGYRALAKKYEISTKSLIERWIAQYKEFGPEGLSKRSILIL